MKATVVLLPTIDEQIEAGDRTIIDPAGVTISDQSMLVFAGFNYNVPNDVLGKTSRIWLEGGRLMAEVDLPAMNLGVSGYQRDGDKAFELVSVGLTWRPRT